jgi:hypothetical protein
MNPTNDLHRFYEQLRDCPGACRDETEKILLTGRAVAHFVATLRTVVHWSGGARLKLLEVKKNSSPP